MAKKNFDNLKNSHLGGGLSNLIPEMNENYESKKTKVAYKDVPKTFTLALPASIINGFDLSGDISKKASPASFTFLPCLPKFFR